MFEYTIGKYWKCEIAQPTFNCTISVLLLVFQHNITNFRFLVRIILKWKKIWIIGPDKQEVYLNYLSAFFHNNYKYCNEFDCFKNLSSQKNNQIEQCLNATLAWRAKSSNVRCYYFGFRDIKSSPHNNKRLPSKRLTDLSFFF